MTYFTDVELETALLNIDNYELSLIIDDAIEYDFSRRFKRKMRSFIRQSKHSPTTNVFLNVVKRAAIIIFAFIITSFTTVISVEALRLPFFKLVQNIFTQYTEVRYISPDEHGAVDKIFIPCEPTYIPKGFELTMAIEDYCVIKEYYDDKGNRFLFEQDFAAGVGYVFNTEGTVIEKMKFDGRELSYISNLGEQTVFWEDNGYSFVISGSIDKKTLLKMVKSTKF